LTESRGAVALLLLAVTFAAGIADAQVLYKLIGRDGQVTYSDKEPKNFDGKIIRIETDAGSNILPSAQGVKAPAAALPVPGIAEERRKSREELEQRLKAAQARVEAARKARSEAETPNSDEMRIIQNRFAPLEPGQQAPRANCFPAVDPGSGVALLICPLLVPGDSFYDRQKKLDDDLALAEEELRTAERAYRRGTD
jgi:hypothetical protein